MANNKTSMCHVKTKFQSWLSLGALHTAYCGWVRNGDYKKKKGSICQNENIATKQEIMKRTKVS